MVEAAPKRSAGRWLVILASVGAVIGVLCCGGYGLSVGGFLFAFRGLFTVVLQAMFAPGTSSMKSLGCEPAMVIDGEAMTQAMRSDFERWGMPVPDDSEMKEIPTMLLCQVSAGRSAPDPEEVARAYVGEVQPAGAFLVMVQGQFGGTEQTFDATGAPTGPATKR